MHEGVFICPNTNKELRVLMRVCTIPTPHSRPHDSASLRTFITAIRDDGSRAASRLPLLVIIPALPQARSCH